MPGARRDEPEAANGGNALVVLLALEQIGFLVLGVVGAATASKSISFVQAAPAAMALTLVLLAARSER